MELTPSAHQDSFARDNLPPAEQWPTLEFTLPELQYPQQLNAGSVLIDDAVNRFGADRSALLTPDGVVWSYGELQRHANQVAQVLVEDLGIVPGNRVMLRSPNNPWLVAAWLGALKAGAVVVTVMPALRAKELRTLLELTRPAAALCDHRFLDDLAEAAGNDMPVLAMGGSTGTDLTARCAAKRESSTPSRPLRTTSRCWGRPPGPPARRRSPCTSTATSSPMRTPSPGTSS